MQHLEQFIETLYLNRDKNWDLIVTLTTILDEIEQEAADEDE